MDQIIRRDPQAIPDYTEGTLLRCAFTGYRPQKLPFGFNEEDLRCVEFKQQIRCCIADLVQRGYSHFLTGCAQGFDTFAAEAVMDVRRKHPRVVLEAVVPFDAQPERWTFFAQFRYRWILNQADIVTWTGHEYTRTCLAERNRYLVDHCDLLLAAYDGQPGGTAQTVAYAQEKGREVQIVPVRLETRIRA